MLYVNHRSASTGQFIVFMKDLDWLTEALKETSEGKQYDKIINSAHLDMAKLDVNGVGM